MLHAVRQVPSHSLPLLKFSMPRLELPMDQDVNGHGWQICTQAHGMVQIYKGSRANGATSSLDLSRDVGNTMFHNR